MTGESAAGQALERKVSTESFNGFTNDVSTNMPSLQESSHLKTSSPYKGQTHLIARPCLLNMIVGKLLLWFYESSKACVNVGLNWRTLLKELSTIYARK